METSFESRILSAQIEKTIQKPRDCDEQSRRDVGAPERQIEATLPEISRLTILHHYGLDENESWKGLTLDELSEKFLVKDEHKKNSGLFVTLIKNGDTRACWGSINATQKNLVRATVFTTEEALIKDYRYTRIKKSEINQLIPQVTVVKRIVPINSISTMRPLKQGLMVRAGGKGAVLLPGEASDPHYQLVKTKLKAGIPSSQPCQLYKIEADVYR
jgi:AMMECR1 domain-containing protein